MDCGPGRALARRCVLDFRLGQHAGTCGGLADTPPGPAGLAWKALILDNLCCWRLRISKTSKQTEFLNIRLCCFGKAFQEPFFCATRCCRRPQPNDLSDHPLPQPQTRSKRKSTPLGRKPFQEPKSDAQPSLRTIMKGVGGGGPGVPNPLIRGREGGWSQIPNRGRGWWWWSQVPSRGRGEGAVAPNAQSGDGAARRVWRSY